MEKVPIFKSIEEIEKSIINLTDFEKLRCKRAFTIPLSNTNKYLKRFTTDDIMNIAFFVSTLFLFLVSTSEEKVDDKDSLDKTKQSVFGYIKEQMKLSNKTLRYAVCFIALVRIAYEIFMVNFMNIRYSLSSRRYTMIVNLLLIITLVVATNKN